MIAKFIKTLILFLMFSGLIMFPFNFIKPLNARTAEPYVYSLWAEAYIMALTIILFFIGGGKLWFFCEWIVDKTSKKIEV